MKLLFAHGWGFDRTIWDSLLARLPGWPVAVDDRGYFGAPRTATVEGSCLAVTHSFGTMRVLGDPPPGLAGIVAINGFAQFTALPGKPGVPVRVVDHMLKRFAQNPRKVLADFRAICGAHETFDDIDTPALKADLLRLRDARPPLPAVPVVSLQGGTDPLLPEAMRAACFDGAAEVHRVEVAHGRHLLPLEATDLCARAIEGAIRKLGATA